MPPAPEPPAPRARPGPGGERLPLATQLAYGAPSFASAAMAVPIAIHMTKFYADTVLVPLGYLGVAIAVARAFDAITDPLMGWLSDRTRSRFGRRRPYLALGAPLCGLAFLALFSPPRGLGPEQGFAWFAATFLVYFLFHTTYLIPHVALGPELTLDYHERSRLYAVREGFLVAGTLCGGVLPGALSGWLGDERAGFAAFAAVFGALVALGYGVLVLRVRERPEFSRLEPNPLVPGVRRALRNRPFRILLATLVVAGIPGAMTATLLPFFNAYVVRPADPVRWLALLLGAYFGAAFLGLPGWLWVARRFGKRAALLGTFAVGVLGTAPLLWAGEGDTGLVLGCLAVAGTSFGAISFVGLSMKADVIDHDELHTGKRREAQYTAFWSIVPKFVQIPSAALPVALLGSLGYLPNQPQSAQVVLAIKLLFALAPALCLAAAFLLAWRFPIDARAHAAILAGIGARRRGEGAADPVGGAWLPPPASRGLDEATGWFLDHFSPGELRRALRLGPRRLVRDVGRAAAVALLVLLAAGACALHGLAGDGGPPGVGVVTAVVVAGAALAVLLFHLLRLGPARRAARRGLPPAAVRAHLAGAAARVTGRPGAGAEWLPGQDSNLRPSG